MCEQLMDDEWLIIHTPGQPYVWNLGELGDDYELRERLVYAARLSVGFPATDDWATNPQITEQFVADGLPPREVLASSVMLSPGEPHHTLMARAVVGTRAELEAVSADAVDAYRRDHLDSQRRAAVEAHAAALASLDPEVLAAILAHPSLEGRAP